jgi:hypothetical protein
MFLLYKIYLSCPKNYKCNPDQGKCDRKLNGIKGIFSISWKKKIFNQSSGKTTFTKKVDDVISYPNASNLCKDNPYCR